MLLTDKINVPLIANYTAKKSQCKNMKNYYNPVIHSEENSCHYNSDLKPRLYYCLQVLTKPK